MRTTKPISTIWYGTEDFLRFKLDDLVRRREIDFYAFVEHYPEEDEKKRHRHVYLVPSKRMDTNSLRDYLTEFDPNNPKPIIPLPFWSSKFGDWYLYNKHDTAYLASKGQERKYHYEKEDFKSSDDEYFTELIHSIDMSKFKAQDRIKSMIEKGYTWDKIVWSGVIPVQQIKQYEEYFKIISRQYEKEFVPQTKRNGGKTHDDDDLPF